MANAIIHRFTELLYSAAAAAAVLFGFFLLFYLLERRVGGDLSRYRTRHFWNDVAYALFYRGDFYQLFIGAAVAAALQPRLAFLQLDLFEGWPLPARAAAFWISADFLAYWLHRLQHRIPFLWAFHSVHHGQERMTFLTSYRIHPIEQLIASLIMFGPLLVIGLPPQTWLPLVAVLTALEFSQHSDLPWRFGPLYRVVVSPAFHAIHHSVEPRHHDKNFGKILSAWDVVFGTTVAGTERPLRYGIHNLQIPESLLQQLVFPFRLAWNNYRQPTITQGNAASEVSALGVAPDVVLKLLKSAGTTLECELRGASMGRTLPHGSRLRLRFGDCSQPAPGDVVAFIAGTAVTVHRVAALGRFGGARDYVLTRGDGAVLLDHPIPRSAILGIVSEWKNGDAWQPVPAHVPGGWRSHAGQAVLWPTVAALHIHHGLAMTLTVAAVILSAAFRNGGRLLSGQR